MKITKNIMKEVKIYYCDSLQYPENVAEHEAKIARLLNGGWQIEASTGSESHMHLVLSRNK